MNQRILHIIFLLLTFGSLHAQNDIGNEWIKDYNKIYYKIKVGADGLYRIPAAALSNAGLGNVNADAFQLWNNGAEVVLYATQANTPLAPDGFIEFYGKINDGKFDTKMYANPKYQTSDKWSLLTDTAVYFLTINTSSQNLRFTAKNNLSSSSALSPESYFNHTYRYAFKDQINPGNPNVIAGVNVYSSSFDEGEGWTSRGITSSKSLNLMLSDLQTASTGSDAVLRINFFGGSQNTRNVSVSINGTSALAPFPVPGYSSKDTTFQISRARLTGNVQLDFLNNSLSSFDQYMVGQIEISYPRKFDFSNTGVFEFSLDASVGDKLLEITSFKDGGSAPVLLDLTNNHRYIAESIIGKSRFLLPADAKKRNFVLLAASTDAVKISNILSQQRFINYAETVHQGNFIIIADSLLRKSTSGDAIENYRSYRSGLSGGGYKVLVVNVDQLVDQFAYGIKRHPLALKRFIQLAYNLFKPKHVLLVGKGVTYDQYRLNESSSYADRLNLVPTFGNPGSDHILASKDLSPLMQVPIGRLSVVNGNELNAYLEKLKQHEDLLNTSSAYQRVDKKGWTKNVLHLVAGGVVQSIISRYMRDAKEKITDSLFGAKVTTIEKATASTVETASNVQIDQEFANGVAVVNYFGHSSLNAMEFNLDDPGRFNNQGKYPLFLANACTAGNNFFYDSLRFLSNKKSISEAYVLEPQKGSIAFVASTHFGILTNLNDFIQRFYERLGRIDYFKSIGEVHQNTIAALQKDFGALPNNLVTMEQILIHGDPATRLHPHPTSDYVVEAPMVSVNPQPLTVAESYYDLKINVKNIGSAHNDSVKVHVKRERADGSAEEFSKVFKSIYYGDSIELKFSLDPKRDLGVQTISVSVDPDNALSELSETNNSIIQKINIIDNEVKPVFPKEFAIVNKWPVKLSASIGLFSSSSNQYIFQVDTTANFNSILIDSTVVTSNGGLIEFLPTLRVSDSTVVYWRVAKKPVQGATINWFNASFVYISAPGEGWSQSSYFQFKKNSYNNLDVGTNRVFEFSKKPLTLFVQSRLKSNSNANNTVEIGNAVVYNQSCDAAFGTLEFSLITKRTGTPIKNTTPPGAGRYGSFVPAACFVNLDLYQYWFNYNTVLGRTSAATFFDLVPNGTILILNHWNKADDTGLKTVEQWNKDVLYNKLLGIGFTLIDSFKSNVPFTMIAYKNEAGVWSLLQQKMGKNSRDEMYTEISVDALENNAEISFPLIGPSKGWKSLALKMNALESSIGDNAVLNIVGVDNNLNESKLYSGNIAKVGSILSKDTSLSFINASNFPWIKLTMNQSDPINQTPPQIKYLQVKYDPVPEGGLGDVDAASLLSSLDMGNNYQFKASFKNISTSSFDSVKVLWKITDDKNRDSVLFDGLKKKLGPGDTIIFDKTFDTRKLSPDNLISLSVNPQNSQPEQFMFNNYLQTRLKVNADVIPPLLDVTFDGVHILNGDIVSSKPNILIQLKDDNAYLPLNDTSLIKVRLRYPDGSLKTIRFDGDTLTFKPSENPSGGANNTASIQYKPILQMDGDYELMISAKDRSENSSGATDYSVMFQVTNQSMITNLLNYPNPFTTSTAFVFTLTGSELPTNMRIQILTITGKIVKEITLAELGPLKIGNNITDYKWDGRDQYGQLLANGVYLYRVITDIKGKKIDKLNRDQYNTDQYFKSGYGKMYLMR